MNPQDANPLGNVHGGVIMKLVDETGGIVAIRHSGMPAVTVAIDSMTFLKPIRVGNLVSCHGEITYGGNTSMEIRVDVVAEDLYAGTKTLTNTAYLVYVALDHDGKSAPVPQLAYQTDEERKRGEAAQERQAYRKHFRARETETNHE